MARLWSIDHAGVSHVGCVRRINEDAWLARPEVGLFAIADGIGGHDRGNVASRTVIEALAGLPLAPNARTMRTQVEKTLAVVNHQLQPADCRSISGSTVVALLMCGRHFAVLWASDSRAYRCGPDGFAQVTRDHSFVQDIVDRDELTRDAARTHQFSNLVTRAVGAAPELLLEGIQGELKSGDVSCCVVMGSPATLKMLRSEPCL